MHAPLSRESLIQIHKAYYILESSSTDTTFLSCIEKRKCHECIFDCFSLSASRQAHSILKNLHSIVKMQCFFEILTGCGFTPKFSSPSWTGENRSLTVDEFSPIKKETITGLPLCIGTRLCDSLGILMC